MFWGGIMHRYSSAKLPYHLFINPAELNTEITAASALLQQNQISDLEDWAFYTARGEPHIFRPGSSF